MPKDPRSPLIDGSPNRATNGLKRNRLVSGILRRLAYWPADTERHKRLRLALDLILNGVRRLDSFSVPAQVRRISTASDEAIIRAYRELIERRKQEQEETK